MRSFGEESNSRGGIEIDARGRCVACYSYPLCYSAPPTRGALLSRARERLAASGTDNPNLQRRQALFGASQALPHTPRSHGASRQGHRR